MPPSDSRVPTTAQESTRRAESKTIDVLTWELLDDSPVDALVTTRCGGVSLGSYASLNLSLHVGDDPAAVLENRRRAIGATGATLDDLVVAEQVHGSAVAVVGRDDRGRGARSATDAVRGADALVTDDPGVVLCVLVADCAPVVLVDHEAAILGCAHAGWRGTLGGVLEGTVGAMEVLGARPERILAAVGPTISGTRYEVGADVASAAEARLGRARACLTPNGSSRWWFDLTGAVRNVLTDLGIGHDRTAVADVGTGPPSAFFSARADALCGRFAMLARIRS